MTLNQIMYQIYESYIWVIYLVHNDSSSMSHYLKDEPYLPHFRAFIAFKPTWNTTIAHSLVVSKWYLKLASYFFCKIFYVISPAQKNVWTSRLCCKKIRESHIRKVNRLWLKQKTFDTTSEWEIVNQIMRIRWYR